MKTMMLLFSSMKLWVVAAPVLAALYMLTLLVRIANPHIRSQDAPIFITSFGLAGRLAGLAFMAGMLVLASIMESLAQEQKVTDSSSVKKDFIFNNPGTSEKVHVFVGDIVKFHTKNPDIMFNAEVLSAANSSFKVYSKTYPNTNLIRWSNIRSIAIYKRGPLYLLSEIKANDTVIWRIKTLDDNEFIGRILEQDQEFLKLKTERLGEIRIPKREIKEFEEVNPQRLAGGVHLFDNPQATRYFWQPNGYGVKKGEAYYQNVWIFFNQITVGVTDHFSIGTGMVPGFLFMGSPTPVWANAKFSVPLKPGQLNVGAGILTGTVPGIEGEGGNSGFGVAYGVTTFGSRDKNCSIGFGYGYSGGNWADRPTVSFSSMIRISPRGYFLTENYYFGGRGSGTVLLSAGGRRIVNKTGIDFGLFMPFAKDMDGFLAIPWLGITTPLQKRIK